VSRFRGDPVPVCKVDVVADLELIYGAARIEGGAVALLWRDQENVELGYTGAIERSWMGLTWSHQRILARSDVGDPFKLIFATMDTICLLHRSGVEVRLRFG
jgi:hypothetical protein